MVVHSIYNFVIFLANILSSTRCDLIFTRVTEVGNAETEAPQQGKKHGPQCANCCQPTEADESDD